MSKENKKDWKSFKERSESDFEETEDGFLSDDEEGGSDGSGESNVALDHPSYTALEEKLTLAEQKAHENWEKSVRAIAELDNVRRRTERDIANAHRYGAEKLISSLLPVGDSLEQALQLSDTPSQSAMVEGLKLTYKLFIDVLQKHGVTQLDPQGEAFNPQEHEAMSIQETAEVAPNTVLTVFQKGYKLSDRVIRPARVIVSKAVEGK
jgi:molecular chaperone GrpE